MIPWIDLSDLLIEPSFENIEKLKKYFSEAGLKLSYEDQVASIDITIVEGNISLALSVNRIAVTDSNLLKSNCNPNDLAYFEDSTVIKKWLENLGKVINLFWEIQNDGLVIAFQLNEDYFLIMNVYKIEKGKVFPIQELNSHYSNEAKQSWLHFEL